MEKTFDEILMAARRKADTVAIPIEYARYLLELDLKKRIPNLDRDALRLYLKVRGFAEREIDRIGDPRWIEMAWKAMLFDRKITPSGSLPQEKTKSAGRKKKTSKPSNVTELLRRSIGGGDSAA